MCTWLSTSLAPLARSVLLGVISWAGLYGNTACAVDQAEVIHGDVTFTYNGDHTLITASDGSIISFLSFNILPWETVQFLQPDQLSRVLGRITGPEPTLIEGNLLANGIVYLVNPAGITFAEGSVLDVGGIYAAAGSMSDDDFLNGHNLFTGLTGSVQNYGAIQGGQVHLLGQTVANHGAILAPQGVVSMLAGEEILIYALGDRVMATIDGSELGGSDVPPYGTTPIDQFGDPAVENTGLVHSAQGQVMLYAGDMYSLAILNIGEIRSEGGQVELLASSGLVHNLGTVSASGSSYGGSVVIHGPSIVNQGHISADADFGQAGSVEFTSRDHTYLAAGSSISAAGGSGSADGGDVLVHSWGGLTVFADGSIVDVSGGAAGGQGGFAEISGQSLVFNGAVDLVSTDVNAHGTLLIDPINIIINEEGGDDSILADGIINFHEGPDDAYIAANTLAQIIGTILLEAEGDIRLETNLELGFNNDLVMRAWSNIDFGGSLTGVQDLILLADYNGDGTGAIRFLGDAPRVVSSTGQQIYGGDLDISSSAVAQLASTEGILHFTGSIAGGGSLEASSTSSRVVIDGSVALDGHLHLGAGNGIQLHGSEISTGGYQLYESEVELSADGMTELSVALGWLQFSDSVTGSGDLTITTSSSVMMDDSVTLGGSLHVAAEGGIFMNATDITTGNWQVWDGDLRLMQESTTLDATQVTFGGEVLSEPNIPDLEASLLVTGDAVFNAHVGQLTAIGDLEVTGNVLIGASGDEESPLMIAINARAIDFGGNVVLESAAELVGTEHVMFGGSIDGGYDLAVSTDDTLTFSSSIGSSDALLSLAVDAGNVWLGGSYDSDNPQPSQYLPLSISTLGDITFGTNEDQAETSALSTIAAMGDLSISSQSGDIRINSHEKLAVFGDLSLTATSGTASFADLSVWGDIDIAADQIMVWAREPGWVDFPDGSGSMDFGTDIVAGGSIDFNVLPQAHGEGIGLDLDFVTFASGGGLGGALTNEPSLVVSGLIFEDMINSSGDRMLDLSTVGNYISSSIGEAVLDRGEEADEETTGRTGSDDTIEGSLEELGIVVREMTPAELMSSALRGALVISDVGQPGATSSPVARIRINRTAITRARQLKRAVLPVDGTELLTQQLLVQQVLGDALRTLPANSPMVDLMTHVEGTTAGEYLSSLIGMMQAIEDAGLTRTELAGPRTKLIDPIVQDLPHGASILAGLGTPVEHINEIFPGSSTTGIGN